MKNAIYLALGASHFGLAFGVPSEISYPVIGGLYVGLSGASIGLAIKERLARFQFGGGAPNVE